MKLPLTLLATLTFNASAELPVMTDDTRWLGYFVGWEEKYYDYGYGDNGVVKMHFLERGEPKSHTDFVIKFEVQEKLKEKWVTRKIVEDGLESQDSPVLDPKKPVTVLMTVTGDTKFEIMQVKAGKRIVVKPKLVEKKTENEIRFRAYFSIPNFYRHNEDKTEKEMKKLVRSDFISGKRVNDGKKVKVKLSADEVDFKGEKFFPEGATEVEYATAKMKGRSFSLEQGEEEVGAFFIKPNAKLYEGMKIEWFPEMEKLGGKESWFSVAID